MKQRMMIVVLSVIIIAFGLLVLPSHGSAQLTQADGKQDAIETAKTQLNNRGAGSSQAGEPQLRQAPKGSVTPKTGYWDCRYLSYTSYNISAARWYVYDSTWTWWLSSYNSNAAAQFNAATSANHQLCAWTDSGYFYDTAVIVY